MVGRSGSFLGEEISLPRSKVEVCLLCEITHTHEKIFSAIVSIDGKVVLGCVVE